MGIASSDHRTSSLQFAAAVMLIGLIFILRMTICQVTKLFHRNKDLDLLFSPRLSLKAVNHPANSGGLQELKLNCNF